MNRDTGKLEIRLTASLALFIAVLVLLMTGERGATVWIVFAGSFAVVVTTWLLRRELRKPG